MVRALPLVAAVLFLSAACGSRPTLEQYLQEQCHLSQTLHFGGTYVVPPAVGPDPGEPFPMGDKIAEFYTGPLPYQGQGANYDENAGIYVCSSGRTNGVDPTKVDVTGFGG